MQEQIDYLGGISIHAPAWGATDDGNAIGLQIITFQSTHPRGVRLENYVVFYFCIGISIHAPAWGATRRTAEAAQPHPDFNPRTRVGCDG